MTCQASGNDRRYRRRSLQEQIHLCFPEIGVVECGRAALGSKQLVDETEAHALGEIVEKISDLGKGEVTKLTRRKLMKLFDDQPLVSEVEEYEFIKSLWPIAEMPSPDKQDPRTLEEYLIQHTIRNDDLTQQDILDSLGLLSCSTAQLFRFLEEITSAEFQSFERQTLLSGKIDALLQHDNYTLSLKAAKFPDIRFSKWFH